MKLACDALGVDYNTVRELWLADPRINPMHTAVFAENNNPYSGRCLPKDLKSLIFQSVEAGYDPKLLKEVDASNTRIGNVRHASRCDQSVTVDTSKTVSTTVPPEHIFDLDKWNAAAHSTLTREEVAVVYKAMRSYEAEL
jgi:UDP-glucose 6-dehydrogenase